ncbi:alpha/beta fold hydrolase [Paenibacillus lautus]|uniref:alpha/beta fold hydrolase n=1 Tax=Paenibacillus lautus TaxID=1401 RepID=UPI002DB5FF08|nr:alpha/beta hydrolase [Paenibacillus lautus]MEC0258252.1 alpha/beta hydrolase [Paenibacillus lautus]
MVTNDKPTGRFLTEKGKAEFEAAYEAAMKFLPPPLETKDIETAFGRVRIYRFTKEEHKGKEPLLLLPGRSSSTPMWEPNLPGLMKERPSGMANYKISLPTPDLMSAEDLKNIHIPVLALMAEKSTMHNSQRAVQKGKTHVPNIQIENWPGASHAMNGEFPEEVNARILAFVDQHSDNELI